MAGWRRKRTYRTDHTVRRPSRQQRERRQKGANAIVRCLTAIRSVWKKTDIKKVLVWVVQIAVVVLLAVVFVRYFGVRITCLDNGMNPQIRNQQSVMVNRVVYNASRPKRGDIIVFKPRGNEKDRYYVRRIIGMPGEKLQIKKGAVYINGKKLGNDYIDYSIADPGMAGEPIKIPKGSFFVISDNQYNMEDSRSGNIGPVKRSAVYGKAWFVPSISRQFGFLR